MVQELGSSDKAMISSTSSLSRKTTLEHEQKVQEVFVQWILIHYYAVETFKEMINDFENTFRGSSFLLLT